MRALLLDRDDTINRDPGYLSDPDRFELLPRVAEGLKILADAGYRIFVLTNQSGVGRGLIGIDQLEAIHAKLREILRGQFIEIDGIYVCPHVDEDDCVCRKPRPGLVDQCLQENPGIEREKSFILGDRMRDIRAGEKAGIRGILVGQKREAEEDPSNLVYRAEDLVDAARYILTV